MISLEDAFNAGPIAFGGAAISGEGGGYGFGGITESESIDLVAEAHTLGLRVFDTAPIYGFGMSEERLGKATRNIRDNTFIISKCGIDWDGKKTVAIRNDKKTTQRMLEQSLKNLDTDLIDLYMVHWPDPEVDIRRTLDVLVKAQNNGKIKYIGLCNTNDQELDLAAEVANIQVVQNQYHLFDRSNETLFARLAKEKKHFMSWGTLDKGIITGSVNRQRRYNEKDVRATKSPWWSDEINLPKIEMMEKLLPLLEENGHNGLELALGHNLSGFEQAQLNGLVLCGAKNKKQLQGLVQGLKNQVAGDLLENVLKQVKDKSL